MERLRQIIKEISGMSNEDFEISTPYWVLKTYKKGEVYHSYKNVCKHLGFILNGVIRIYRFHEQSGTEKNMLFFTSNLISFF